LKGHVEGWRRKLFTPAPLDTSLAEEGGQIVGGEDGVGVACRALEDFT
jgi:hypothetical protein